MAVFMCAPLSTELARHPCAPCPFTLRSFYNGECRGRPSCCSFAQLIKMPSMEHGAPAWAWAWAWAWAIIMADDSAAKSAMGTGQSLERIMRGRSPCLHLFEITAAPLPRRAARCHLRQESRLRETGQRESRALVGRPRIEPDNTEAMQRTRRKAPQYPLRNQRKAL